MRLLAKRSLACTLAASLLLVVHLAPADAAMMIEFTTAGVTIVDNGPGDSSGALGVIKFDITPAGFGYRAQGTLEQSTSPATSTISLTLTGALIAQVGVPASPNETIKFTSSVVNPFFPATMLTAHLDGQYLKVDAAGGPVSGGVITVADAQLDAYAGPPGSETLFGSINPPPAFDVSAPVPFGPSDVSAVRRFETNIDLRGELLVRLGAGDGIFLPTSASVSAAPQTIPEPSSLILLSLGLLGIARCHLRRSGATAGLSSSA